jgi:hypothetical protein
VTTDEDDDQWPQLDSLANSILDECQHAAPLPDLDTAIYLFREALDQCKTIDPLRSNLLKDLAAALVMRFSLTNERGNLSDALDMFTQAVALTAMSVAQLLMGTRGRPRLDVRVQSCLIP